MGKQAKNRYNKRPHISEEKFKEIIKLFALDLTASITAEPTSINSNSINKTYNKLRI